MSEDGELERRREREVAAGLWPIGRALTVASGGALLGLAAVTTVTLAVLGFPHLAHDKALSVANLLEVLKLVLGTVAGVGALAALVMNYRRQRLAEVAETRDQQRMIHEQQRAEDDRVRVFNERFATAAGQLGDTEPAVRLAGVYAMAGLADDWEHGRQTCIEVLCAYLRMPYEPDPGSKASAVERLAFGRNQEVRHTVINVIATHLRSNARTPWHGHDFDFSGVRFDGAAFTGAQFTDCRVFFNGAEFTGEVFFNFTDFSDGQVSFNNAKFTSGEVFFEDAQFINGRVLFISAEFTGGLVAFPGAKFISGEVSFDHAVFSGGRVDLSRPGAWSAPPSFVGVDVTDPPAGLLLPRAEERSAGVGP